MPDRDPAHDWRRALDHRLAALGVPPARRVEIAAEVTQHLADAGRATLAPDEIESLVLGLGRVERTAPLEPPVLG